MKNMKLRGFTKRRRCVTTKRSTTNPVFADLVKRRFHAEAPNQVYVGDITYLPCKNGTNMYLATVIDLYSRKLAGFAIADHMRTSLVIEALEHANTVRGGLDGAIFHSDHGSVGGFNRSSQHLDNGGVWWRGETGLRRPEMRPRGFVGSGVPTGRSGRRCGRLDGLLRRGWCSASSGG